MAKILIIRLTSLGDVIFTIPLACALKKADENNQVDFVVAEKGLNVIKNNPCITKHYFIPLEEWKKRPFSLKTFKEFWAIIKEIRQEKYDIAIDCQQMFKNLFLFMFCGAKRRITFSGARELSFLGGNEFVKPKARFRDYNYHIVERNLDFARHLGITAKDIDFLLPAVKPETKDRIDELTKYLDKNKPMLVIAPATTRKNKHWAERNWANLIDTFYDKFNFVFTGNDKDGLLIDRILNMTKNNIIYADLTGQTDLEDLIELFSRSKIVISPDSGSAHLAWASKNPAVIAIFTSTPAKRFGPYGQEGKYFSVGGDLSCQPCFKKKCKLKTNKNNCQNSPAVDEIINIVNKLL